MQYIPVNNNQSSFRSARSSRKKGGYVGLPAGQASTLNSSSSGSCNSPPISINPVPLSESLTNRLVIGLVLWDPGTKERHPFVLVQSSSANQNPTADGGSVYKNTESWWLGTLHPKLVSQGYAVVGGDGLVPFPPISGCLQMIILCNILGSRKPISRTRL